MRNERLTLLQQFQIELEASAIQPDFVAYQFKRKTNSIDAGNAQDTMRFMEIVRMTLGIAKIDGYNLIDDLSATALINPNYEDSINLAKTLIKGLEVHFEDCKREYDVYSLTSLN